MHNYLNFITTVPDSNTILIGHYNPLLVAVSILIAILSSYTALRVCKQVKSLESWLWQISWLAVGALALGTGIWAMHFIGMLAFSLPCHVNYDPWITVFSMLPGIVASGIALYLCCRPIFTIFQMVGGGVLMGAGIGVMHYSGMAAMRMNAQLLYEPRLFVISIIVAVVLAIIALWINFGLIQADKAYYWYLPGATVMGLAISGMHYTAMAAANFIAIPTITSESAGLNLELMAAMIASVTVLVSLLVIVATFAHRYYVASKALEERSKQVIDNDRLFLESVLEAVSDPIFVKNRAHHFIMMNEAYCKFMRRPRSELIGKTDDQFFSAAAAERYHQYDEKIFATGKANINEEKYRADDGSLRYIETEATPYLSALGEPLLLGVMRDVTASKNSEQRLFRSEYLLKMAQESSHIGYFSIDLSTELIESSESLDRILGIDKNVQLTTSLIWDNLVYPDDRAAVIERYRAASKNREKFNAQYRIIRPSDGELCWVEAYGGFECIDESKPTGYLLGTLQDISERKKIEQELEDYNQSLEEKVQQRTEELLQSEKMAALGQLIAGIAHEINTPLGAISSSASNIQKILGQTLTTMPPLFQSFSLLECSEFLTILTTSLKSGTVALSAKEQRQKRRTLVSRLGDEIEDADSIADTLVDMGIYEDVGNIMDLLKKTNGREVLELAYKLSELKRGAQTINTAAERASKVVFALKSYARQDNSGEKVSANITQGIDTVLTLYQSQIKHGIELVKNYADNLPSIYCYPDELNQVWTNLIHNSLHAMDNKGTLTINVEQSDASIKVSIQDTGKGIAPENQAKIFDAFFTTKSVGEGSGLGLHIIKKIIDKHSGSINVESQPGCTVFSVLLPIDALVGT